VTVAPNTHVPHGTENWDYLIACDLDDVPIPGFAWASHDRGCSPPT
jgi:hypothetical protein